MSRIFDCELVDLKRGDCRSVRFKKLLWIPAGGLILLGRKVDLTLSNQAMQS